MTKPVVPRGGGGDGHCHGGGRGARRRAGCSHWRRPREGVGTRRSEMGEGRDNEQIGEINEDTAG